MRHLVRVAEPGLLFAYGQTMEDPRDGLTLFGPLDEGKPYGIRTGVIGTGDGIRRLRQWLHSVQGPISNDPPEQARPPFPGFQAVFRIPWGPEPLLELQISKAELSRRVHVDDKYQRVFGTAGLYADPILKALRQEESGVDLWFVVIPDEVYALCRPKSFVPAELRIAADYKMSRRDALALTGAQDLLFPGLRSDAEPYEFEPDFHNQLKARLLGSSAPTQIVRESTIAYREILRPDGRPKRNLEKMESAIAWNIATAAFYKAGGRPWKIGSIRDGVCYIGLAFKKDETKGDPKSACCAAQMFLDSGDGMVFKGAVGPWFAPKKGEFHLSRRAARELVGIALESYGETRGGAPRELFLHGKVWFNTEEWKGFEDAVESSTNLVGVRIRSTTQLKLYKTTKMPILRSLAYLLSYRTAYLWTRGFIPRVNTYPGREVPRPLRVDVCRGDADLRVVLDDIMALTKLNYNACIHSDGLPVTLRFADAVGEILTAGPVGSMNPLPFKYYI